MADLRNDKELTLALCRALAEATGWQWHEDGPNYNADEVSIVAGELDDTSDRMVGVTVYQATDLDIQDLHWRMVQFRLRGGRHDHFGADSLSFRVFESRHMLSLQGGVHNVSRRSFARLGADDNGRQERTDNYTITLDNQED